MLPRYIKAQPIIRRLAGCGASEGEREGKGGIQDSGSGDLGIITSRRVLGNRGGRKVRSQMEDAEFCFEYADFEEPTRGDAQWVIAFADLKFRAES